MNSTEIFKENNVLKKRKNFGPLGQVHACIHILLFLLVNGVICPCVCVRVHMCVCLCVSVCVCVCLLQCMPNIIFVCKCSYVSITVSLCMYMYVCHPASIVLVYRCAYIFVSMYVY